MANNPQFPNVQSSQPHLGGSMDPPHSFVPPIPTQFRPLVPTLQSPQQFIPAASHFQQVVRAGPLMSSGLPSQPPQVPFSQSLQPLPVIMWLQRLAELLVPFCWLS